MLNDVIKTQAKELVLAYFKQPEVVLSGLSDNDAEKLVAKIVCDSVYLTGLNMRTVMELFEKNKTELERLINLT